MAKKVFLGVGHGGSDPGAVANGFKEKDLNLPIALACKDELERHGVQVKLSRYKDENDSLTEEINECNAYGPDLAVDIHNNAGGGDGAEAYYTINGGVDKMLAVNILAEILVIGQNTRGAKTKKNEQGTDYYGFIRQTTCPAIIVECAFVDNATDIQIIDSAAEQKIMGIAIAKGILETLGIAWKAENTEPESADLYLVWCGGFTTKPEAEAFAKELAAAGPFTPVISKVKEIPEGDVLPDEPVPDTIKPGDTVVLKKDAPDYNGKALWEGVYKRNHKVKEINGQRVVITYNGVTVAAVKLSDLSKV